MPEVVSRFARPAFEHVHGTTSFTRLCVSRDPSGSQNTYGPFRCRCAFTGEKSRIRRGRFPGSATFTSTVQRSSTLPAFVVHFRSLTVSERRTAVALHPA